MLAFFKRPNRRQAGSSQGRRQEGIYGRAQARARRRAALLIRRSLHRIHSRRPAWTIALRQSLSRRPEAHVGRHRESAGVTPSRVPSRTRTLRRIANANGVVIVIAVNHGAREAILHAGARNEAFDEAEVEQFS